MRRGYLLLETVLALSIFVVAVVGLLSCLNAGQDADYEQRRLTNMRLNLQSRLDEAMAMRPEKGSKDFDEDAYHLWYRREIEPVRVRLRNGKELKNLFKVSVFAFDTQRDNRRIGELWTYASP